MKYRPLYLVLLLVIAALAVLIADPFAQDTDSVSTGQESAQNVPAQGPDSKSTGDAKELQFANSGVDDVGIGRAELASSQPPESGEDEPGIGLASNSESAQTEGVELKVAVHSPDQRNLAGVPVTLWTLSRGRFLEWQEQVTNADGLVTFPIPLISDAKDYRVAVGFGFPCQGSKPVQIQRSEIPAEPIALSLEPTGSVEIQLIGPDDKPWPHATEVRLAPAPGFFSSKRKALRESGPAIDSQESDSDGKVVFPCAGLNKSYITGAPYSSWGKWQMQVFAMPNEVGAPVQLQLKLLEPVEMVRFRLLDPQGAPVANRKWTGILSQYTLQDGGGLSSRGSSASSSTDAEGYSLYPIDQNRKMAAWTLRRLKLNCRVPAEGQLLRAHVDLTAKLSAWMTEIGDVQLTSSKELVSGRILSDRGTPVPGVRLSVEARTTIQGDRVQTSVWDRLQIQHEIQLDGSFSIRASTLTDALKLTFKADGFHPLVQEVGVGSSGHEFAFEASFVITGHLQMAADANLKRARIHFIPPGSMATGSMRSGNVGLARIQEDGQFMVSGLKDQIPGEIAVFYGSGETALERIADVSPLPAEAQPDPRLNPLCIGEVHHYEVNFVDGAGEKVRGVRYLLFQDSEGQSFGTGEELRDSSIFSDRMELRSQLPEFNMGYYAEGYQYGEQLILPGQTTITLQKAILATLRLENALELPPGTELRAELVSDAASGLANGRITLPSLIPAVLPIVPIPAAGTYGVKLTLRDIESRKSIPVSWQDGSGVLEFEVGPHAGQEFSIAFPNDKIRQAAEKLRDE